MGPILDELGLRATPKEGTAWPRMWWVAIGCLSILPIHAAGYPDSSTRNALDRVISSYTPTIKALVYAREKASKILETRTKEAMIVAMPTTPDRNDLPYVESDH